jgi:hypothetical protein
VPHHCRRIGHAGLAGAIFEYGRNLGTGNWSTLSHLSDMDFDRLARLEDKLDARADHETRIRVLERFRWLVVAFAAAVSAITQYVTAGQVHMPSL